MRSYLVLSLLYLSVCYSHKLTEPQSPIIPARPSSNSQAYLRSPDVSIYRIQVNNRTSCRFKTSLIPCNCLLQVSDSYVLKDNGTVVANFSVGPPNIEIQVPTNHEILQELNVFLSPKLCIAEKFVVKLFYRSLDVFPSEGDPWSLVTATGVILHEKKTSVALFCEAFSNPGYYRVSLTSTHNYTIESDQLILVNRTSETGLRLRNDSIFPHCYSDYAISWTLSKCVTSDLHYRLRILAVPEGNANHEDRAMYIEEIGLEKGQTALSISCSQFDIIYEKYCFELVSVNKNTSTFHLWHSICVSTEPVPRVHGGWSAWSEWSECSVSCGHGSSRRIRFCDNPVPNRGRDCEGEVMQSRNCSKPECPVTEAPTVPTNNCTCGCTLLGDSGTFYVTASSSLACSGNQTWRINIRGPVTTVVDFTVDTEPYAKGKLFFFRGAPYEELMWFSGSNQEPAFTLHLEKPLYVVLWSKDNSTSAEEIGGFTVGYNVRVPPVQLPVRSSLACHPFCPETIVISGLGLIFMLIIFIPPFICASITYKFRQPNEPDLPLLDKKYDNEMIRSGNTECTQISQHRGAAYIAKRSIGIQLSVQSTPKFTRACASADSPLPRGASSMSASDELEYDYYDGTTIPGSLLAPVSDVMYSQIDIDQIIGQSELFINNVEKQDVHTQI